MESPVTSRFSSTRGRGCGAPMLAASTQAAVTGGNCSPRAGVPVRSSGARAPRTSAPAAKASASSAATSNRDRTGKAADCTTSRSVGQRSRSAGKPGMVYLNWGDLTAQMSRTIGVTVAAAAAFAAIAPASAAGFAFTSVVEKPSLLRAAGGAVAGTHYGASAYRGKRTANPTIGLVVRPDGRVSARAGLAVRCGKTSWGPVFVRMSGKLTAAPAFTASGHTRLRGHTLRISAQGSADGQNATGTVCVSGRGCRGWTLPFTLRTESAPAGAPAVPPPSSIFTGLTAQAAGGVRLPVSVTVTHTGKMWAIWDVTMKCHGVTVPTTNVTPLTKIRADGSFSRSERFNIRYRGNFIDHYKVRLTGQFRADGVSGTLRASMQTTKPGHSYYGCFSGTQAWAARP